MTSQFTPPLFEMKADGQGLIEGLASTFGGIDSTGDSVQQGAYAASLAAHRIAGTAPAMLWSHRSSEPVGRWTTLQETPRGLFVKGQLNLHTNRGNEAFQHLRAGDLNGLSIGYSIGKDGAESRAGIRLLKSVQLHEVSLVCLPADSGARISSVKERRPVELLAGDDMPETRREFERMLQALGFTKQRATALASKGWVSEGDPSPNDSDKLSPAELQALAGALMAFQHSLKGTAP